MITQYFQMLSQMASHLLKMPQGGRLGNEMKVYSMHYCVKFNGLRLILIFAL